MVTPGSSRSPAARLFGTAIVVAAVVVLALASLSAVAFLGRMVDNRWQSFPGTTGLASLALAAVPCALLAGGVVALRRASVETLRRWTPLVPLLLVVALRLIAIVLAPTPIADDNDPRYLHELAVGVLEGGNPLVAHRPMGYSTALAALYAAFGVQPVLAELLNLAAAVLAGWLLFTIVDGAWGRRAGAVAVLVYAIVPSQILMVTAVFTETLYGAVLLAAIGLAASALAAHAVTRRGVLLVAAAGVVLAASQYVRPVSQSFLPIFAAAPFLTGGLRLSRAGLLSLVLVGSFVAAMMPIVAHNATVHGALSLSTSSYGGWSVYVGANQEHDGRFNRDDQAVLAETPGGSVWERSEALGREGIERITTDPSGFASLAVRKFRVLWADDTYAVTNAFPAWDTTSVRHDALRIASQAIYAAVAALAVIGLWRSRRDPPPAVLLIAGIVVTVAIAHVVVEVQPRYHAYLVPLLCALAAPPLAGWRPTPSASDQRQVPGSESPAVGLAPEATASSMMRQASVTPSQPRTSVGRFSSFL